LSHIGGRSRISGAIEDARIYSHALSADELKTLQPNKPSKIKPYAWWDFEGEKIIERTGRFVFHNVGEGEDVDLKNGKLVLGKNGFMISIRKYEPETPVWPNNPPDDWLTFHLAHPGPGRAEPGDPNPAFYYKDRYHMHYIYANLYGYSFAHISSTDMVYWKWHPTVLAPPNTGHGMFSGTGFFTKEGKPAMIYHGVGSGRNHVAIGLDDNLDQWTKPEPVLAKDEAGKFVDSLYYWDPDCWLIGDTYYALSGGKDPELMKSDDLHNWKYLGKLLHEEYPDNLGVNRTEDISCANMFQIGNKWMLLCISHRLGCRYFLGNFKDEKYLPDFHAKMNWLNTNWEQNHGGLIYFAPESMMAADGRRVMWAWLITTASPSGIQSLPRELELPDDGMLRIKPLRELEMLRYDELKIKNLIVKSDNVHSLPEITGDAIEMEVIFAAPLPKEFGVKLLADEKGEEGLSIAAGSDSKTLSIGTINPPFVLKEGEDLILRIFIDKNLVEVFANDRQAAAIAHKHIRENPNISLFSKNTDLVVTEMRAWKMKSIYKGVTLEK
jgi:beta-fructofuranosidase